MFVQKIVVVGQVIEQEKNFSYIGCEMCSVFEKINLRSLAMFSKQ